MNYPFYNPDLSRAHMGEQTAKPEAVPELLDLLHDPRLRQEALHGNITVAMIRPELEVSSILLGKDTKLAETLEAYITELGVLAKFALRFDRSAAEEFYAGTPRDVQLAQPPMRKKELPTRWDEFVSIMTAGPTTVLLLHTPDGDAIEKWRRQVGHWNIEANRDPATLRGRFGLDNYNNLVHGSDSPESAVREIDIIARCLTRQA